MYNLKNVKKTHRGVLLLVKLQTKACNFTKSNTSLCVNFTFCKLYKVSHIQSRKILCKYLLIKASYLFEYTNIVLLSFQTILLHCGKLSFSTKEIRKPYFYITCIQQLIYFNLIVPFYFNPPGTWEALQ